MSSGILYRLSGVALLVGALLAIIGSVLSTVLFPGMNDPHQYVSALWLPVMLLSFIGSLLLVVGLPGIVARQATRAGWLGLVGFALTIIGGILFTSLDATTFLVLPWLAVNAPKLAAGNGPPAIFVYFLVAILLFAVGGVLLGIATMRAGVLPRWAGLLIIIGAALNLLAFLPSNGIISSIGMTVTFVFFGLGFAWIGYALVSGGSSEVVQPSPASSQAGS